MGVYLGIDLGTTGLKVLLVREDGTLCATGYRQYPIVTPAAGYAEQDPAAWWHALQGALADACQADPAASADIKAIGLSGQMHGTVLLNSDGELLCPAILWCDQRANPQVEKLRRDIGPQLLGQWVQNPIAAGFQAATLMWVQENQPERYRQIAHVLLPKDYIRFLLTGQYATEPTDACSTLLFNCAQRTWSADMLSHLHMDPALLPEVLPSPMTIHGELCRSAAQVLDLQPGIPVVCGGGDQPMQAIGNGILKPGDASITLGTGGQIFVPITRPAYDPVLRVHTFCHAQENTWYSMGAILNCCLAQNWLFDKVLHLEDPAAAHAEAASAPPGSDGLCFLPYLTGERTPHMDATLTASFHGLTLRHSRAHIIRATIEGITFALREALDCIRPQAPDLQRLVLSGGGARSALWKQIMADVMEQPIYATCMTEEAGLGAAICAMVGVGAYATLQDACQQIVRYSDDVVYPQAAHIQQYREGYERFKALGQNVCR